MPHDVPKSLPADLKKFTGAVRKDGCCARCAAQGGEFAKPVSGVDCDRAVLVENRGHVLNEQPSRRAVGSRSDRVAIRCRVALRSGAGANFGFTMILPELSDRLKQRLFRRRFSAWHRCRQAGFRLRDLDANGSVENEERGVSPVALANGNVTLFQ